MSKPMQQFFSYTMAAYYQNIKYAIWTKAGYKFTCKVVPDKL